MFVQVHANQVFQFSHFSKFQSWNWCLSTSFSPSFEMWFLSNFQFQHECFKFQTLKSQISSLDAQGFSAYVSGFRTLNIQFVRYRNSFSSNCEVQLSQIPSIKKHLVSSFNSQVSSIKSKVSRFRIANLSVSKISRLYSFPVWNSKFWKSLHLKFVKFWEIYVSRCQFVCLQSIGRYNLPLLFWRCNDTYNDCSAGDATTLTHTFRAKNVVRCLCASAWKKTDSPSASK